MELVSGELRAETEKAILIVTEDGVEHWIPRSVIEEGEPERGAKGEYVEIYVADWFHRKILS